jgi:hypothetical protein
MPRFTFRSRDPWRTSLIATVVVGLLVAACGGSSSSAPAGGSGEPSTGPSTAASQEPGESQEPGASQGGADFSEAASALDALDSYKFSVEISTANAQGSTTVSEGTTTFSGTVINAPDEASSLHMVTADNDGNVTDDTEIVLIGADAWMRSGGATGEWQALPAGQAGTFVSIFDAFRPEQMFSIYFGPIGEDASTVGQEERNGVQTTHYQGGEAIGAILGAIAGVQGSWHSDIWIAVDGGYVVHSEAAVQGSDANGGGSFSVVVDITDIESAANTVEAPM